MKNIKTLLSGSKIVSMEELERRTKAKYGENFERDHTLSKVVGRWKTPKEKEFRRRWNGRKYVYEEVG